ncbi:hypothetical protein OH76DRAFT_731085 [Lentinus brumalis]|uniref:Uncharacterized protein n=1 Tax=Lentinus brumalis TaxID=2498619 RepID=A0A371DRY9_9APHY|nr:hypothetical protein OH76DRAFT_731085 [Polyporus brumalis]
MISIRPVDSNPACLQTLYRAWVTMRSLRGQVNSSAFKNITLSDLRSDSLHTHRANHAHFSQCETRSYGTTMIQSLVKNNSERGSYFRGYSARSGPFPPSRRLRLVQTTFNLNGVRMVEKEGLSPGERERFESKGKSDVLIRIIESESRSKSESKVLVQKRARELRVQ